MGQDKLRIGLVGAGTNMRARHIPALQELEGVEIAAVCNRRPASTVAAAKKFGIAGTFAHWQDLVEDRDIDAIVIGTWPYLHCPITLAALETGKHVLTEARLSSNAAEAHRMLAASKKWSNLVTQVVPSPYGLKGNQVMAELIAEGFLGELQEVHVYARNNSLGNSAMPLSWRQDAALSGFNMLTLGIIQETLLRWLSPPVRVMAQVHAFVPARIDPESGVRRAVGTPDSVQVLAVLENGGRALYQLSGVAQYGQGMGVWLYGTEGILHYDLTGDRIHGSQQQSLVFKGLEDLEEIPIPLEKALPWRVEAEFVDAIRTGSPVRFTDFETGVNYMEFTEAVARSAQRGEAVDLPLTEFFEEE